MARKSPANQLPLDFTARGNRVVLTLTHGEMPIFDWEIYEQFHHLASAQPGNEMIWSDELLRLYNLKLPYPKQFRVVQSPLLDTHIKGFSAIIGSTGWIFLQSGRDPHQIRYDRSVLMASLGLSTIYYNFQFLRKRSELLADAILMPARELKDFFPERQKKITASFLASLADFFKVPVRRLVERAYHLDVINSAQYGRFAAIENPFSERPDAVCISQAPNSVDDLEKFLFGGLSKA